MELEKTYPGMREKIEKARSAGYTDEMIQDNINRLIYKAYDADSSSETIRKNLGVEKDFKLPTKATILHKALDFMTAGHMAAPGPPPLPEVGPSGKINIPATAEKGFFEDPVTALTFGGVAGVKAAAPIGKKLLVAGREALAWATGGLTDVPKIASMGAKKVARGAAAKRLEKSMAGTFKKTSAIGTAPGGFGRMAAKPGARVMGLIKKRRTDIDVGILESEEFIRNIERKLTPAAGSKITKQQNLETIPFLIQGIKDPDVLKKIGREDLIPLIQHPSSRVLSAAEDVKNYYSEAHTFMKQAWGEDIGFVENYVTQIWDIPKAKKQEVLNYFTKRNPFLKRRAIPTLEEGIKLGLKPRTTNIAELLRIYDQYKIKTVHNMKLAESLKDLVDDAGNPLIMRQDKAPPDWTKIDHPALNRAMAIGKKPLLLSKVPVKVNPEIAKEIKVIFDEPINNKWINAYETTNAILKKSMLSVSLFHHQALTESAFSAGIGRKAIKLWNPAKLLKEIKNKNYAIFQEMDLAKDAIKHNVTFGALEDIQRGRVVNALESVESASKSIPVLNKLTKGARKANELWDAALWDYYHNSLKLFAYESNVAKSLKSAEKEMQKKLGRSLMPKETKEIKDTIGLFINDSFGGQNWELDKVLGNPKVRQMMQWFWLAPDWCVDSTTRAMTKTGWKFYNEIAINDEILAFDPETQKLKWLPLLDKYINEDYNGKMIRIKNWRRCIMMTPDHTCYVQDRYKGFKIVKAHELNASHSIPRFDTPLNKSFTANYISCVGHSNNKEEIDYKGIIWCPSVDTGFWLAEREGLMFITGNTLSVLKQAAAPFRGVAKMATPKGDLPRKIAGKALTKRGSLFWAKACMYYNLIAQSVNYRNTKKEYGEGRFTWENPPGNKLNMFIGRNEDGTERYLRMGKQFREVIEWGENPLKKVGAKLSPLLREGIRQFSAHDPGSGYPTEWAAESDMWKTIPERAKSIAEMPIPFSLRPYVRSRPGVYMFTFPTKKGMTNYKTIKLFKEAIKDDNKKEVKKLYIHALENNLNALQLLKSASASVKADITYDDKGVAKDILNELSEMTPEAKKDAYNLYEQRGIITPNIKKQMERLIKNRNEIARQKEMLKTRRGFEGQ